MAIERDPAEIMKRVRSRLMNARPGEFPQWRTPAELNALHVAAQLRDIGYDIPAATAWDSYLRLTGTGVNGHAASARGVGQMMVDWQNLVTAIGAALNNITTARGQLPLRVVDQTRLDLVAAPLPGSVVLHLRPNELSLLQEQSEGLADTATAGAMNILNAAIGDAQEVVHALRPLGPRVGSATRKLAQNTAALDVDLEVSWSFQTSGRRFTKVTARDFRTLTDALAGKGLDEERTVLRGVLRTISDIKKVDLEVEGVIISIDTADVDFRSFHHGQKVTVDAIDSVTQNADGTLTHRYRATGVTET